jgi:hypothetical protein
MQKFRYSIIHRNEGEKWHPTNTIVKKSKSSLLSFWQGFTDKACTDQFYHSSWFVVWVRKAIIRCCAPTTPKCRKRGGNIENEIVKFLIGSTEEFNKNSVVGIKILNFDAEIRELLQMDFLLELIFILMSHQHLIIKFALVCSNKPLSPNHINLLFLGCSIKTSFDI